MGGNVRGREGGATEEGVAEEGATEEGEESPIASDRSTERYNNNKKVIDDRSETIFGRNN